MTAPLFFLFTASKKLRNWSLKIFIFFIWSFLASHLRNWLWKIAITCRRKWAGDWFWHWQAAIRCWLTARGKKVEKNHKKFTIQWQILPCKSLGLAPPSCQFLLPTRGWKAGCWAANRHPKKASNTCIVLKWVPFRISGSYGGPFLASQDALEVMRVTHSLTHLLTDWLSQR